MSADDLKGAELFAEQLRSIGYNTLVDGSWVEFSYTAPGGTHEGTEVTMAINVPVNFPLTPPGGIDFSPRLPNRPIHPGGEHPIRSHDGRRFKGNGEYWSRPFMEWHNQTSKDAKTYIAWVNHLWITT